MISVFLVVQQTSTLASIVQFWKQFFQQRLTILFNTDDLTNNTFQKILQKRNLNWDQAQFLVLSFSSDGFLGFGLAAAAIKKID